MRPSFDLVEQYLFYDAFTALIYWKKAVPRGKGKPYQSAGSIRNGYRRIYLFGKNYKSTHIIWLLVTGEWPSRQIDHINRDPLDDRWENLRLATQSQNNANRILPSNSINGYRGISWKPQHKRWRVNVGHRYRGSFKDAEDAARHYDKTAKELYGEFAILNFPEPVN